MGLLDREYYRDEEGGRFAAWLRQGLFTKILFVINILVFLIQLATKPVPMPGSNADPGAFTDALALVGEPIMRGEIWRLRNNRPRRLEALFRNAHAERNALRHVHI